MVVGLSRVRVCYTDDEFEARFGHARARCEYFPSGLCVGLIYTRQFSLRGKWKLFETGLQSDMRGDETGPVLYRIAGYCLRKTDALWPGQYKQSDCWEFWSHFLQ